MKREIVQTKDGSTTIYLPDWQENYHSKHGAIQEAKHVFIKNGFLQIDAAEISILEIGFGTGLNAFITFLEGKKANKKINYSGVEAYPVDFIEIAQMNYVSELQALEYSAEFQQFHTSDWNVNIKISDDFCLMKRQQFFDEIDDVETFDLIYFDAFGYRVQPEVWSTEIFYKMHKALKRGGTLVTYAARGVVKRSMVEVGFSVEKLEGPPGKREMFRATKT